jgi:hypothetical protein
MYNWIFSRRPSRLPTVSTLEILIQRSIAYILRRARPVAVAHSVLFLAILRSFVASINFSLSRHQPCPQHLRDSTYNDSLVCLLSNGFLDSGTDRTSPSLPCVLYTLNLILCSTPP